jgi:hypothetical protein
MRSARPPRIRRVPYLWRGSIVILIACLLASMAIAVVKLT